jgi:hypothetical protein
MGPHRANSSALVRTEAATLKDGPIRIPVYAHLIHLHHESSGDFVVDAGLDRAVRVGPERIRRGPETLLDRLDALQLWHDGHSTGLV